MKLTLAILQTLHILLAAGTAALYFFRLNFLRDQAITGTSLCGMFIGAVLLFLLGTELLKRKKQTGPYFLHAVLALPLFLGQCAMFLFILWQRPF